jgi:hypothetical protein
MPTKPENPPGGGDVNPSIEGETVTIYPTEVHAFSPEAKAAFEDEPAVKKHLRKILRRGVKLPIAAE